MAKPGKIANHQASVAFLEADNNCPQVTVSGGTPTPKKDKKASTKIDAATPKATAINTGESAFGSACLNKDRILENPKAFEASMYSNLF